MGGAAGHMRHPFDLPQIKTGSDLTQFFITAAEFLTKKPGAVKIDGVNVSFKLIERDGQKEFASDRGSLKPIDIEGITLDRVEQRYAPGHGMIPATRKLLKIFNEAIPKIKKELEQLGMWDDPTRFFNTEYVAETTNVTEYDHSFLAIHGINQFYQKTHSKTGATRPGLIRPTGVKAPSTEVDYDEKVLESLIEKVRPIAKRYDFEIYSSVPTSTIKGGEPFSFEDALDTGLTITPASKPITMSLGQWLGRAKNPKNTFLKTSDGRKVEALNKDIYLSAIRKVEPASVASMLAEPTEENVLSAVNGIVFYHATRVLGNEILNKLTSPMGDAKNHEGVVLRNRDLFGPAPVKITGEFIVSGMQSSFREEEKENLQEDAEPRVVTLFPGAFKPPHAGHYAAAKHYANNPNVDEVRIIISKSDRSEHTEDDRLVVTAEMSNAIWQEYLAGEPKMMAYVAEKSTPVREAYEEIDNLNPGDTVMFVMGEKDANCGDDRFAAIPRFAKERGISYDCDPVTGKQTGVAVDLSATEMRRYVLSGNKNDFFKQLPRHVMQNHEKREKIFNLLQSGVEKKINESISSLADIRSLVEEVLSEVETEKQRRWACAQMGDDFKGERSLTKAQAEEMCKSKPKKKKLEEDEIEEISTMAGGGVEGYAGGMAGKKKKKKRDSLIREDDEQFVKEVLDYILSRGN